MIINFDSEWLWKGINVYCMKVPYHRTGIYPEGSIDINITSQCAVPLSSFEPNTHQPGGCPCHVDPQWTWPFSSILFCQNPDGCPWVNVQQELRAALARKRPIFLYLNWRTRKEQKTFGLCVKLHLKRSCWLVFAALVIRILVKSLLITLFYRFVLFSLTLFTLQVASKVIRQLATQ